jgi:5-formyltetrahydrofolate cyclo-ligase
MNEPSGSSLLRTLVSADDRVAARRSLIDRRQEFNAVERCTADGQIAARVDRWFAERLPAPRGPIVVGAYWPVRGEPSLVSEFYRWQTREIEICLPGVAPAGESLQFGRWTPNVRMVAGRFGIEVPDPFEPMLPQLLIVPCVGFDARGYRLGYGAGFYDRTLAMRPVPALGVSYDFAEVSGFVPHPHDRPLDAIATELRLVTIRR